MRRILSALVFQAGWLAAVIPAGAGRPWIGACAGFAAFAVLLALATERRAAIAAALAGALVGGLADLVQIRAGVISLSSPLLLGFWLPPWFTALWLLFGAALPATLRWMYGRPLLAAALGAVGGPLSYLAGQSLGAITVARPLGLSLAAIAAQYTFMTPALLAVARRIEMAAAAKETSS